MVLHILFLTITLSTAAVENATIMKVIVTQLDRDVKEIWKTNEDLKGRESSAYHINTSINTIFSQNDWSNCQVVSLHSRNNLQLVVRNGKLRGVMKKALNKDRDLFQIESYGSSIIRFRDIETKKYIIMNANGEISLSDEKTQESLFYHHLEENSFHTFASVKYYLKEQYDLFLAVRKSGKMKLARFASPGQKSSQFIPIHITTKSCKRF